METTYPIKATINIDTSSILREVRKTNRELTTAMRGISAMIAASMAKTLFTSGGRQPSITINVHVADQNMQYLIAECKQMNDAVLGVVNHLTAVQTEKLNNILVKMDVLGKQLAEMQQGGGFSSSTDKWLKQFVASYFLEKSLDNILSPGGGKAAAEAIAAYLASTGGLMTVTGGLLATAAGAQDFYKYLTEGSSYFDAIWKHVELTKKQEEAFTKAYEAYAKGVKDTR